MTYLAVIVAGLQATSPVTEWQALKRRVRQHYGARYNHTAFVRGLRRGMDQGVLHREGDAFRAGPSPLNLVENCRQVGELREERLFFRARVGRKGYERGRRNARTVLLHDVRKAGEDAIIADHAWVRCTGGFQDVPLDAHVRFCARVRVYRKVGGHDYKFFYPNQVEAVSSD